MKLAATDFDGTLYKADEICRENIAAIQAWRAAGHKFGVITGRDYGLLVPQLRYFGIADDFAVCNNGAIIFDGAGRLLYQAEIKPDIVTAVALHPCVKESLHVAFSQADRTCIYQEREGSWIFREARQWDFPLRIVEKDDIAQLQKVQQIALGFASVEAAGDCAAKLNALFGESIHAYQNRASVDITPPIISKSEGIKKLLELMDWKRDSQLYVIGDETNDLPMIRQFQGYAIASAREEIRREAQQTFSTVGSMLRKFI